MGRKKYSAEFKARVAIEAIKEEKTINEIASYYGVHPQMVRTWKREFLKNASKAFEDQKETQRLEKELEKAYKKIGELEVEKDFLSDVLRRA